MTQKDAEDFITAWENADNVVGVSRSIGMPIPMIRQMAKELKESGVTLKDFTPPVPPIPPPPLDVAALNAKVSSIRVDIASKVKE